MKYFKLELLPYHRFGAFQTPQTGECIEIIDTATRFGVGVGAFENPKIGSSAMAAPGLFYSPLLNSIIRPYVSLSL